MRLLLDESVPRPLKELFKGHIVDTVQSAGWLGLSNGELLRTASQNGYEALITVDKGFEHQQNPETLPLTVAVLKARSNRLEDLEPLVPMLLRQLSESKAGALITCGT